MNKISATKNLPKIDFILQKYGLLIFICLSLITSFLIFKDFFTGYFLYYFKDIGSDTINITFPNYLQYNYLSETEGYFKTWTFYTGMGQRIPNPVTLNPYTHIIPLLNSIFGLNLWFYRIYFLYFLYFLPAGIITYYYFKTLNYSNFISIIGGLLLQFSGYMIVGSQWGHAFRVLYSVFLFFSFEQLLVKKRWWYFPIAIYLLSDNFFSLAVNSVFLFFYSIARYFVHDEKATFKGYIMLVLKMIGLAILAVMLNAPRAIPNFLTMYDSPRVSGNVSLSKNLITDPEFINLSSLEVSKYLRNITTLIRFFGNDLLGSGSDYVGWNNYLEGALFYIGLISLLLMFLSFFYFSNKQKILYGFLLLFWLCVAFIPILRHAVNFFMGNYFKNSIDIFVPFIVLFFAMFSLENIFKEKKVPPILIVVISGILLVLLHFPYFINTNEIINPTIKIITSIFLLAYTFVFLFVEKLKNIRIAKVIILIFVIFELVYISRISVYNREVYLANELKSDFAGYNDGTMEILDSIKQININTFYRIEKDYTSGKTEHSSLNDAKAQGFFSTPSYGSFNQSYYIKFLEETNVIIKGKEGETRWAKGVRGIPLLMAFANVKYYFTKMENNILLQSGYDSVFHKNGITVLENQYFLPFGNTYSNYLPFNDFKKLNAFKKQQALLRAVIVEKDNFYDLKLLDTNLLVENSKFNFDIYSEMIDSLKKDVFTISKFRHRVIEGNIKVSDNKFLFFTIPYDKGWRIYINGKEHKPELTNIGFIGIYLKKGEYNIILKHFPPYFKYTVPTAIFGMLILMILIFILKKKQKLTF